MAHRYSFKSSVSARFSLFAVLLIPTQSLVGHAAALDIERDSTGRFIKVSDRFAYGRSGHNVQPLDDGRILVAGGAWGDLGGEPWAEIIDPKTSKISTLSKPMAHLRSGAAHAKLPDGRIILIGGAADFESALNSSDIFDPKTETFVAGAEMAEARAGHAAVAVSDGRIFVFGGNNGDEVSSSVEVWDPSTSSFKRINARMNQPRSNHTATLIDNRTIVIAGGETQAAEAHQENQTNFLDSIELFDIQTQSFHQKSYRMQTGRVYHSAVRLDDHRLLIAGGLSADRQGTDFIEIFDLTEGTVSMAGLLNAARSLHTGSLLSDGSLLFAGGVNQGMPLSTTERCRFSGQVEINCLTGPKMSITRWLHAATPLPDGRIMISGGLSETPEKNRKKGGPSRSLEIFTP
jgi:hypothetical protein